MLRIFLPILLAGLIAGCSTFSDQELAGFRAKRVTPPVYSKLSKGDPVEPSDVLELHRRGVSDSLILRQIEDHGVSSLISRNDVARLRKAGVSAVVIDSLLHASNRFARDYSDPAYDVAFSGYYGPAYYDPWPWYGGFGLGLGYWR